MASLPNKRDFPPGGWEYTERATGVRFVGDCWTDLLKQVNFHREYKGIPTTNTAAEIEEQICLRLSGGECVAAPGEDYRPVKDLSQSLTLANATSLNKAVISFLANGAVFNEPDEMQARAAICAGCPFSKPSNSCSCHIIYKTIAAMIPADRKPKSIDGRVCTACGCSLPAKVNLPLQVVADSLPEGISFPPWCWQKSAQSVAGKTPVG